MSLCVEFLTVLFVAVMSVYCRHCHSFIKLYTMTSTSSYYYIVITDTFILMLLCHLGKFQFTRSLAILEGKKLTTISRTFHTILRILKRVLTLPFRQILRQAGYTERAIAIYQALLELNLFSPPLDSSSVLVAMEPFWDARLPRVGEPGARGWADELAARRDRPPAGNDTEIPEPTDTQEDNLLASGSPKDVIWRDVEALRAERHWLPWDRPGQEDDCEDTDRIVLFEDVKAFLFRVAPELRVRIVEDFVAFLCSEEGGECVVASEDSTLRMLAAEATTLLRSLEWPPPLEKVDSSASPLTTPPLGPKMDSPEYAAFIGRVLEQTSTVVPSAHRMRLLQRRMQFLTRRAARISVASTKDGATISTTSAKDGATVATVAKETRRRMKAILKSERQSVPLFAEYAEFERTTGSTEVAFHVLQTALAQCAADDPVRFELVHRYCLLLATTSSPAEAIDRCRSAICSLFGEVTPSAPPPPHQLVRVVGRLRRLLPELTGLSAGGRVPQTAVHVTCCLAWSQLITAGIQEAADVITAVLGDLSKSQARETSR